MTHNGSHQKDGQRGQGLVELSLVLPIVLVIFVTAAELGLVFGRISSLGYGTREGARTGSALADGGYDCGAGDDPAEVDNAIISAVQRILKSPDSGIDLARVDEIQIYKATDTGAVDGSWYNVWDYAPGAGPKVDEVDGLEVRLDFQPVRVAWRACERENDADPDSIGVSIKYHYEYTTPLPALVNALTGGSLELTLEESTVMALNPTVESA